MKALEQIKKMILRFKWIKYSKLSKIAPSEHTVKHLMRHLICSFSYFVTFMAECKYIMASFFEYFP